MESINEEFLYLYSNDRIKLFESSYYQKDDINIPKYDLFNSRNDFYNQRDDAIIPRDYFYNQGDYFHNPKDEIFQKNAFQTFVHLIMKFLQTSLIIILPMEMTLILLIIKMKVMI